MQREIELVAIMQRLLSTEGCPWDREQTHESLRPYVIEEAYEVVERISKVAKGPGDRPLQDVKLQTIALADSAP